MAKPRKLFSQLSVGQQKRKLSHFQRIENLTPAQIKSQYNAGTLSQKGARGHKATPEHPREAVKVPTRHKTYRPVAEPTVSNDERERLQTLFVQNVRRLKSDARYYNDAKVQEHSEKATFAQLIVGINATDDDLDDLGSKQEPDKKTGPFYVNSKGHSINPFWYHPG